MFSTYPTPEYDFLTQERVNILLDHGYCGFSVINSTHDACLNQFMVKAMNIHGTTLTAKGETMEDACKKMIDQIDLTVEDY